MSDIALQEADIMQCPVPNEAICTDNKRLPRSDASDGNYFQAFSCEVLKNRRVSYSIECGFSLVLFMHFMTRGLELVT